MTKELSNYEVEKISGGMHTQKHHNYRDYRRFICKICKKEFARRMCSASKFNQNYYHYCDDCAEKLFPKKPAYSQLAVDTTPIWYLI